MRSIAHLGLGVVVYTLGVIILDQKYGLIDMIGPTDLLIFGVIFSLYNFIIDVDANDSLPRKIVTYTLIAVVLISGYLGATEYVISSLIILIIIYTLSHRGNSSLHNPTNMLIATLPLLVVDVKYVIPAVSGGMFHILTDYLSN